MNPVFPLTRSRSWAALRYRGFLMSQRGRCRTRYERSRGSDCGWSGKTRIRLHCSRGDQHHQRNQSNGRDSRNDVNPSRGSSS